MVLLDLAADLDRLVQPLLDAGWVPTKRIQESSYPPHQSLIDTLYHGWDVIEVELFADGLITVWPYGGPGYPDNSSEPLITADSAAELFNQYSERGWLHPQGPAHQFGLGEWAARRQRAFTAAKAGWRRGCGHPIRPLVVVPSRNKGRSAGK